MAQLTGAQPGAALLQSGPSVQRAHRHFAAACPARSRRSQITCTARSEYDGPVALPRRQLIAAGTTASHICNSGQSLPPSPTCSCDPTVSKAHTLIRHSHMHAGGLLAPLAWAMPSPAEDSYIPVKSLSGFQRGDQRAYFQVAALPGCSLLASTS